MKVTVNQTAVVRPAEETPAQRMWLSNLDLLHTKIHYRTIYVYKNQTADSDSSSEVFFDGKVLKEALSKALVPFYPMAGRLTRPPGKRMELDCNGEGALFLEAETEAAIDELGEFLPTPEVQLSELVPSVDYSQEISSLPLLLVQVTKFKCGGVCLGVAMHHMVTDGAAANYLINTWSEMARTARRGLPPPTVAPFLDRTILRARDPPPPSKFHHTEYDPHPTPIAAPTNPGAPTVHVVKITPELITTLKAKASCVESSRTRYSSHDILTAHIWRCATKARGLADEQQTKLQISVDGRSRLNPPTPPMYFGNVIFHCSPIATAGELASETIADTAERIRRAIGIMDDEYLRSAIDCLEGYEDDGVVRALRPCQSPNLKLVSWMRLPFRDTDFGWGSPVLIRKAAGYNEGSGHILPMDDDGSLPLVICLEAGAMDAFEKLFYET